MGLFVLGATVAWAATAVAATPVRVAGHTITMDKKLNAALPPSLRSKGVVSVASAYPYPPWEYTKNGSMTGVEADLAKALGAKLGVKLQFHNVKFDGLIPGVIAGNYDVLIAAIHDTKDRQKQLTFIDEASVGSGFLVKKGNPNGIKDLASLCGKTVVVQASSAQVAYVNGFQSKCGSKGKITKLTLPDSAASVLAITTDKAQAYFSDKIALQYIADTTNKGKTVEVVSNTPKGYGVSPVGISVKKGNDKLANALKGAMQSLIDDGSYQAILDSYNFGFAALKKATINGATK
ncbi:MAG TPA: ABC transporter substrate-binding protein [Solirubrobacteraceae bacterium]|nr:ABC transporter substrate-binding protein [Solirubrobacteraceae bacterium]